MEPVNPSVTNPPLAETNLGNGSLSLSEHLSPTEAPVEQIIHGMEVTDGASQNSSLELKLDLYVPVHPIIEPISPAEETVEERALPVAPQEVHTQLKAIEEETNKLGDTFKHLNFETQSNQTEPNSDIITEPACGPELNNTSCSDCGTTVPVCVSVDPSDSNETNGCVAVEESIQGTQEITPDPASFKEQVCETDSTKNPNSNTSNKCAQNSVRKNIPPKKDKFAPLKTHIIPLTSSQLSLQCLECHIIFQDQKSKKRHLKSSHPAEYAQCMLGDALFACYVCDRHFTCSADLRAHQSTHTEREPFKCPVCNKAFRTSSELTGHKKIHLDKQGYSCVECGKAFKNLTLLRYHQRVHTGDKPYICFRKNCGRRFATSKSLLKHVKKHEEDDTKGAGDRENASTPTKKRRNKGLNEWKFKCSQCDAVFKTAKTQLLHIKNKHSRDKIMASQSSTLSVPQAKPLGPVITQTIGGQKQYVLPHQIDVLDAEQIKRLIEKFENVKKVNQLVIMPIQTQSFGLPHPQGLIQPLHLNFTQSTVQPTECKQTKTDPPKEQSKLQTSSEMEDLQQKENVVLSQEEKTPISTENSDSGFGTQVTPAEPTEAQTQIDEVLLELTPVQTETSVFLDQAPLQVEMLQNEQTHRTEFQQIQVTHDTTALETTTDLPLILQTEKAKTHNFEEENVPLENDVVVSEETVVKVDMLCSGQIQDSTDFESDSRMLCGQSDTIKLTEPQEPKPNAVQKDRVDLGKKPSVVKPQSQIEQLSFNNVQNDASTGLPAKPRKKNKKTKQKVITKPNKTKQKRNQQKSKQDKVIVLSQQDNKLYFTQKVQKVKKGKESEGKSEVEVKPACQTNEVKDSVSVVPEATQMKPQKRKMKNQKNHSLIKKVKSVQEVPKDETLVPVQRKKKQSKTSPEDCAKKSKVRKNPKNDLQKNTLKMPKHKETNTKCKPDAPDQAQIEQQALLLLKGHKQPQLKVHKLDATELEKSPPKYDVKLVQHQEPFLVREKKITQSKSLSAKHQKKVKSTKKKSLEKQGEPLSPVDIDFTAVSLMSKPKIIRKRKAPTKIDQEIALSPPYSRLTLGCQDCGRTFSEVSALQEHMASLHSAEKVAFQCEAVNDMQKNNTRPNDKHTQPNVMDIQVATDWEMGEILGDREERRVSFPVLSSSPSLPLSSSCVEGKEQEGHEEVEGAVSGLEQPPEKNPIEVCQIPLQMSTPALVESIVPQDVTESTNTGDNILDKEPRKTVEPITETSCSDLKDAVEEEIKEELPLEVNLVMVGEQKEEEDLSLQMNILSDVSQECGNKVSNSNSCLQPEQTGKDAGVVLTQTDPCLTEPEIKQEEEEILVHKADDPKTVTVRSSATKGKKGVGRGQARRLVGRRGSRENRHKKDMEAKKASQDCQVVYQLCVLDDTSDGKDKETDKNGCNIFASETCVLTSSEESPEDQVVFELDSVTTSVVEVMNSEDGSFIEKSAELIRDDRSPGIILEKYLTACERNAENLNTESQRIQANLELNGSKVTSACTTDDVKTEECLNPARHTLSSSERGVMRGVQMFLVKAEEHLALNEPEMFQAQQPTDTHRLSCQDKAIDKNRDGVSSGANVVPLQSYSKQCIFYPVKEEEREHLVEPPPFSVDERCSDSRRLEVASSGAEECEEIHMGSVQMEMHHLYTNSEEGDVSAEQQSPQGFLEFLSQNSDADDSDIVHSEPEAETIVMSCYHGIQSNATAHQNGVERCGPRGRKNVSPSQTAPKEAERQLIWKPIDYFSQYFSWDAWKEIAVCTGEMSKLPNPVTEKEVAQYVGIHIAMGTLKFPSIKLYWEDLTRVPLVSDAMCASRFSELTRTLRLASDGPSMEKSNVQQSENRNRDLSEPNNEAQSHASSNDILRVFSQSNSNEEAHNCTNLAGSKSDPLWKVTMLIKRVQEGCQALQRNGSYGVDQYPIPFQKHPTHSLLHTVVVSGEGLVVDFNLSIDDSNRETVVEKMVSRGKDQNEGMVFLCKPELSTPAMLEHLLEAGVQSAGKVGGARGQIGDEFVSSDGKLKLFRCHHGFILSAVVKEKPRSTSLVSGFERAIKAANLNRDLRSLYRTPSTNPAVSAWPQSVLWDLIDLVLVNAWIQYKQDYSHVTDLLSLMAFRLDVAKALILSSGVDAQEPSPPCPPAPKQHGPDTRPTSVLETPLPDAETRYDGFGHWPEQLAESAEAKCRFGGCKRMSRVRCLKCCVFLCISQNHNCFLKFHSQRVL